MVCEYCGIAGHMIQECEKIKCLKCNKSGHLFGNARLRNVKNLDMNRKIALSTSARDVKSMVI